MRYFSDNPPTHSSSTVRGEGSCCLGGYLDFLGEDLGF